MKHLKPISRADENIDDFWWNLRLIVETLIPALQTLMGLFVQLNDAAKDPAEQ